MAADLRITLESGLELRWVQAMKLADLLEQHPGAHWHPNECGCCITIHLPHEGAEQNSRSAGNGKLGYVVGPDGHADLYRVTDKGVEPVAPRRET